MGFVQVNGEGGASCNGVAKEEKCDTKHGVQSRGQFIVIVGMASMSAEFRYIECEERGGRTGCTDT
jgi:hypothetical protein